MYQCASNIDSVIESGSRTFRARILTSDNTVLDSEVLSLSMLRSSNAESEFTIGTVISQYITATISKPSVNIENSEIHLNIGILVDDAYYDFPFGYFSVSKPEADENSITFTAYDRMLKLEKPFSVNGTPTTISTVAALNTITSITGVPVNRTGLVSYDIPVPQGLTCREVLGLIAQIYGGFAVCNRQGSIVIKQYTPALKLDNSQVLLSPDQYWDTFQHNEFTYQIDKITCIIGKDEQGEPITYSAGSGTRQLTFSNSLMSQTDVNRIYTSLSQLRYMPGTVTCLGDPRLDPWDIILIEDNDGNQFSLPVMNMEYDYDGGLTTTITAVGQSESDASISFVGPNTKAMDRYYAELVTINRALVNKLDATEAQIIYATIENLDATNANIRQLETDYVAADQAIIQDLTATDGRITNLETEALTADSAVITTLESNYANIQTLLSGSAGVGELQTIQLTSENASIDVALIKSILANNVTVNDLLAGNIITNRQKIISQDGSFEIDGSTQTIKDENGNVRIQLGKDQNGNFTFVIFDSTGEGILIDSNGITDNAIADGLIKDAKVADDAAIQGSKLDIESVFTALNENGESSLHASKIVFDDTDQTLVQTYTTMSQAIEQINSAALTASDNANRAIRAIEGISSLDNLTAILSNDAHVVHTLNDGTGGDYTTAFTEVRAYKGDSDVTDNSEIIATPSSNIVGTWNNTTHIYQITSMTGDDGYVDFDIYYGTSSNLVLLPDGNYFVMPDGNRVKVYIPTHVRKRFSISKSRDGRIGVTYNIQSSVSVIRKRQSGNLIPSSITFSALYSEGGALTDFTEGIYKIDTSTDGTTWTNRYTSSSPEASTTYTPPSNISFIRCELYDANNIKLDVDTVTVMADADELASEIALANQAISTLNTSVTNIETGVDGINIALSETQESLQTISNNVQLYRPTYTINDGTINLEAHVYNTSHEEITTDFPPTWFEWIRVTEDGRTKLGTGYTMTDYESNMGYGGTIISRFLLLTDSALLLPDNNHLILPDGNRLTLWAHTQGG